MKFGILKMQLGKMMLKTFWEVCDQITANPQHVETCIDSVHFESLVEQLKQYESVRYGPPAGLSDAHDIVLYELIANSVNFCYWTGRHDIRTNGASARKMYSNLTDAFKEFSEWGFKGKFGYNSTIGWRLPDLVIERFINLLSINRFPHVAARNECLKEIRSYSGGFEFVRYIADAAASDSCDIENLLTELIRIFPNYGDDTLLKRAVLFFLMLNRDMGWFQDQIHLLPVPADYQIPKVLRGLNCLSYSKELSGVIGRHEIIPSGSLMEMEIRASTIVVCRALAEKSGKTMNDVDSYLWTRRKETNDPFHLTITKHY